MCCSTGLAVVSEISELVLPEHEVAEPMFRLILLAAREIERTADWSRRAELFCVLDGAPGRASSALPDRCAVGVARALIPATARHSTHIGSRASFARKDRRSGMRPLPLPARQLAETFATQRLDRVENAEALRTTAKELREADAGSRSSTTPNEDSVHEGFWRRLES